MFLKKFLLATVATTALAGAAFGITACGEEPVQEDHVHNYSWSTKTAATCTDPGVDTGTCSCGSTIERRTPAQGHATLTETPEQAATCGSAGHRAYWTCSKCNNHFADAEGKRQVTVEEMTITVAHSLRKVAGYGATCTSEGMNTYYTCTNCNKNFSDENGASEVTDLNSLKVAPKHTAVKVDGKAATCTETGIATYYSCSACGKNFSDEACTTVITDLVTEAKGHTMTKVDAVAATCTAGGSIAYWTCSDCHKYFSDEKGFTEIDEASTKVAALGHDMHHVLGVASSCYHTGTIEHWACYTCHKRFDKEKDGKEIEDYVIPESHDYKDNITARKEATCTDPGTRANATCRECGKKLISMEGKGVATDEFIVYTSDEKYTKDLEIECKPHNTIEVGDEEYAEQHPATCTTDGWAVFYWCQDCGSFFKDAECTKKTNFQVVTAGIPLAGGKTKTPEEAKKTLEKAQPTNGDWSVEHGLKVKALGHLTETRVVVENGVKKEVPFYHYDRDGHWLICRRDCCAEHPRFNLVQGKEFGSADAMTKSPIGTEVTSGGEKVKADAHTYSSGSSVCVCGWVSHDQKTEFNIPKQKNSLNEERSYIMKASDTGLKDYWNLQEDEYVLGPNSDGTTWRAFMWGDYGGAENLTNDNCLDLTLPYKERREGDTEDSTETVTYKLAVLNNHALDTGNNGTSTQQIKTVIIPWTVRYIEDDVFYNFKGLENIIFEEAPEDKQDEAELWIVGGGVFGQLRKLKSITFPSHLKGIASRERGAKGNGAFESNGAINEIIFNSVVKDIKGSDTSETGYEVTNLPLKLDTSLSGNNGVKEIYACVEGGELPTTDDKSYSLSVQSGCKTYYFGDFTDDEIEWIEKVWLEGTYSGSWVDAEDLVTAD